MKKGMNPGPMKSLTPSKGGVKASGMKSAEVYKPAGSGSRPVPSKFSIPVSAPKNAQGLDSRSANIKVMK